MTYRFLLPVIFAFGWTLGLSAQTKFFLDVSGNYSISQDIGQTYRLFTSPYLSGNYLVSEHFESKPGLDFNVGISKNIYRKFNLTIGIGISAVQFKKTFDIDYSSNLYPTIIFPLGPKPDYNRFGTSGGQDKFGQVEIMYVTVPIEIQYPVTDKLVLAAGIKNSIITYSSQIKQDLYYGKLYTDKSSDGLANNLISGDIGLQYKLFKRLWLSTSYNHYFTAAYDEKERMAGDLKYKTFRLGLKYDL